MKDFDQKFIASKRGSRDLSGFPGSLAPEPYLLSRLVKMGLERSGQVREGSPDQGGQTKSLTPQHGCNWKRIQKAVNFDSDELQDHRRSSSLLPLLGRLSLLLMI